VSTQPNPAQPNPWVNVNPPRDNSGVDVCLCVCLSAQKLQNYISELEVDELGVNPKCDLHLTLNFDLES